MERHCESALHLAHPRAGYSLPLRGWQLISPIAMPRFRHQSSRFDSGKEEQIRAGGARGVGTFSTHVSDCLPDCISMPDPARLAPSLRFCKVRPFLCLLFSAGKPIPTVGARSERAPPQAQSNKRGYPQNEMSSWPQNPTRVGGSWWIRLSLT